MSCFTNTGSDVIERQVVESVSWPASHTLEELYDIGQCVTWITKGQYHKVCLQFPDELLCDAASVAQTLTQILNQQVYILGDTTYASCCVDEVAAEHIGADAVIHFGNTCLSPSQRLPVLYITTKLPVNVTRVVGQIKETLHQEVNSSHPLVLLCDTRCQYAGGQIFSQVHPSLPQLICSTLEGLWNDEQSFHNPDIEQIDQANKESNESGSEQNADCHNICDIRNFESKCRCSYTKNSPKCAGKDVGCRSEDEFHLVKVPNDERTNNYEREKCQGCCREFLTNIPSDGDTGTNPKQVKFNGRKLLLPNKTEMKDCSFIYLGPEGPTLDSFLLRFAENTFYHVTPCGDGMHKLSGMQSLFRRNVKLEMIRDASIIGILVGTLGVSRYRDAIARLKTIIKSAGKRSYTFVVGKPNEPKLANISEIDVFVYVACAETTIVNRASDPVVYRKVVAPWEVEVALISSREWSTSFEPDFQALLPGGGRYIEVCEATRQEEASVSLITNQTQTLGLRESDKEDVAGRVLVHEGKALAALHVGGGGQVLGSRSWAGLDPSQPPPCASNVVVEGRKGISAEYQDEKVQV